MSWAITAIRATIHAISALSVWNCFGPGQHISIGRTVTQGCAGTGCLRQSTRIRLHDLEDVMTTLKRTRFGLFAVALLLMTALLSAQQRPAATANPAAGLALN